MKSKIIGISIIISLIAIISLSNLAIGQKGNSPGMPMQENQPMMERGDDAAPGMTGEVQDKSALDMQELIDQEYPYDRKDELRQKVSSKVDQLNQRISEVENQMNEMRDLRTDLEKSLIRMEYVDESDWDNVRNNVKETAQEVSEIDLIGQE